MMTTDNSLYENCEAITSNYVCQITIVTLSLATKHREAHLLVVVPELES